jgi:NADH-quinone oxidoreductase subunit L
VIDTLTQYAWLIPVLPLMGFVVIILFGHRFFYRGSAWLACSMTATSFIISLACFVSLLRGGDHPHAIVQTFDWISSFAAHSTDSTGQAVNSVVKVGVYVDQLSSLMLMLVAFIATLTQFYSIGYMHDDPRYSRFFAYKNFFVFSMLGLVAAPSFFQMFIFWELVGLSSYLLIGFWFEKTSAADACKKAFITNRIGDVGFLIGILLLFYQVGTVTFSELTPDLLAAKGMSGTMATVIGIALFCGAIGKSAQFPLHVWLPDAMEGPTSVSALIHSATMVAAGVYMIVRAYPVFATSQTALLVIAILGIITALGAALIALTQTDIKRVLAYSTLSQLGYMVFACGCLGPIAAFFHLMTHAFFKSMLFLGSGSVIHGMHHEQDIRHMGGLRKFMPITHITFLIGCLALSGCPLLSGFFSKDELLFAAYGHNIPVFALGVLTALLTAFYTFRLYFITFWGKFRGHKEPHESPFTMTAPLVILSLGALFAGAINFPFVKEGSKPWLISFVHVEGGAPHDEFFSMVVMGFSAAMFVLGLLWAGRVYWIKKTLPPMDYSKVGVFYKLSLNKFYVDEIYKKYVIDMFTFRWCAGGMAEFDRVIVDGFVNLWGRIYMMIAAIKSIFDKRIIDGLVNLIGWITRFASLVLRRSQTGYIQNYMLMAAIGLLILLVWSAIKVGAAGF